MLHRRNNIERERSNYQSHLRHFLPIFVCFTFSQLLSSSFAFTPSSLGHHRKQFSIQQYIGYSPTIPSSSVIILQSSKHETYIKQQQQPLNNSTDYDPISPSTRQQSISEKKEQNIGPKHIAIICDGNSRWAKQFISSSLSNILDDSALTRFGHSKGASRVISTIQQLKLKHPNVNYVTMYGFSTENWTRSKQEIADLWNVFEDFSTIFHTWAMEHHVRVRILGDLSDDRLPDSLRQSLIKLQEDTTPTTINNMEDDDIPSLTFSLAINYGGRQDIINASRKMVNLISKGEMSMDDLDKNDVLEGFLSTSGIPDPDLVIRTGGEQRLSNFLIWNCAYSELYFTDTLWPDFDEDEMKAAIDWYINRDRRFGGRADQSR